MQFTQNNGMLYFLLLYKKRDSVPASRRLIFFRWVSGTNTATATDSTTNGVSVLLHKKYERNGNEIQARMEESDT